MEFIKPTNLSLTVVVNFNVNFAADNGIIYYVPVIGTNQPSGLLVRHHNHYDTLASGAAATPTFVVIFLGKRSYRQPSPHRIFSPR